jgi:histidinol-phosphate/aromatic aminotransferase/cobyric acid decarboxylase-like protein
MGFPDAIRVSVGTPAENEKFLAALAEARSSLGDPRTFVAQGG